MLKRYQVADQGYLSSQWASKMLCLKELKWPALRSHQFYHTSWRFQVLADPSKLIWNTKIENKLYYPTKFNAPDSLAKSDF